LNETSKPWSNDANNGWQSAAAKKRQSQLQSAIADEVEAHIDTYSFHSQEKLVDYYTLSRTSKFSW
jgi:hypothetical protein